MGGVTKEYFTLLFKEILYSNIFKKSKETGAIWFHDLTNYYDASIFEFIGKVCGLAIYNMNSINLPFPSVLFKVKTHNYKYLIIILI